MALDDSWMPEGKCAEIPNADTIFFPTVEKGAGPAAYRRAKGICEGCPVRIHCLSYAIAHKIPYGVWGGTSPGERSRIPKATRREIRQAWRRMYPVTMQIRA